MIGAKPKSFDNDIIYRSHNNFKIKEIHLKMTV